MVGLKAMGRNAARPDAANLVNFVHQGLNRQALTDILTAITRGWTKADLLAACEKAGVPAGPINDMAEVFRDPQVVARGMQVSDEGVPGVRTPIVFSDAELAPNRASPRLNADAGRIRLKSGD